MTTLQKAKELVNKFLNANAGHFYQDNEIEDLEAAKECAIIAVDEILNETKDTIWIGSADSSERELIDTVYDEYWKEVKIEIEKL